MNIIETIRAGIERIRSEAVMASFGNDSDWLRSRVATCVDILSIFDTMEQPVEGLEEEYQEFCKANPFPWSSQYVNREYIDELCLSVARHFAEWGASHAKTPTLFASSPVLGEVHHALRTHYIATDEKALCARLKEFPEGAKVDIYIEARKGEDQPPTPGGAP